MNKNILIATSFVVAIIIAFLLGHSFNDSAGGADGTAGSADREVLYWVAPMDPNYRRDEPGKSPMGMDLVPVYADEVDNQPGVVKIDSTIVNNCLLYTSDAADDN